MMPSLGPSDVHRNHLMHFLGWKGSHNRVRDDPSVTDTHSLQSQMPRACGDQLEPASAVRIP